MRPRRYKERARTEHFDLGCTSLGTESIFFTKGSRNGGGDEPLPAWAIAVIAVAGMLVVVACVCIGVMVQREKAGTPIFTKIDLPSKSPPSPPTYTTTAERA